MYLMVTLLSTLLGLYLLLLTVMVVFQRTLIYHPGHEIQAPEHYALEGFEDLRVITPDHLSIQMWYHQASPGFPTIVYYHGNAFTLANRASILGALQRRGFGVLGVSYRGYGKSQGTPSEQGIYTDARTAISYLTDTKKIPLGRIMLFGESLGTGVSTQMASEYPVAGLILQAAYTSVAARAAEIYFYIPVQLLIRDRFDSLAKIGRVKAPLLMFHGELDQTIPAKHARTLLAAAVSPKELILFPQFSHNDFDSSVISDHVLGFARKYGLIAQ